ncbi:MAG: zinc-ribbon domain-containing protein [Oscillospiraceae bacterium]
MIAPHPPKTIKAYPMNHCKKCGHELSPTTEFCGNCGEPVPK